MATNTSGALNSVLPGFSTNSAAASNLVRELMKGRISKGERNAITDYGAERATLSGMPGSTGAGGTLFANNDLRNIGLASGNRQQQGIQDFLSLLTGFSGNVVPTAGQEQQNNQFNANLGFQRGQADRNYGLQQNEQDLAAAKFNEQYGPREFSSFQVDPATGARSQQGPKFYVNNRGQTADTASALMFKYRR